MCHVHACAQNYKNQGVLLRSDIIIYSSGQMLDGLTSSYHCNLSLLLAVWAPVKIAGHLSSVQATTPELKSLLIPVTEALAALVYCRLNWET